MASSILQQIIVEPGFCQDYSLRDDELADLRSMITDQFLERMGEFAPDLVPEARRLGLERYHELPITFDHAKTWHKQTRILPQSCVARFRMMDFFRAIEKECGPVIVSDEELNWRLVRPEQPTDVGPVHADGWFWDIGYGTMPENHDRFKVWIPVFSEPGRNGLSVKPMSHHRLDWKRHVDTRDGMKKPVLDEDVASLNMQLLPRAPGGLLMFHDRLLHGGAVNHGTRCRVSIELTILFPMQAAHGIAGQRRSA